MSRKKQHKKQNADSAKKAYRGWRPALFKGHLIGKKFIAAILIVLLVNTAFWIVVSCATEHTDPYEPAHTDISGVLLNGNARVSLNDYFIMNWAYSSENVPRADGVITELAKSDYTRVGFVSEVFVQLLENRVNSVLLLWSEPLNLGEWSSERQIASQGTARRVTVVKLFGNYYIISEYIEKGTADESNKYGEDSTAVYRADDPKAIESVEAFRTKKEDYYDYSFYPLALAEYFSTPFQTSLVVLLAFAELDGAYWLLTRKIRQSGHR